MNCQHDCLTDPSEIILKYGNLKTITHLLEM